MSHPREAITLTPPADVKSDQLVSIGALIGIATTDAPKDGEIKVCLQVGTEGGRELYPAWCRRHVGWQSRDVPGEVERK